jgi:hypothetical protein
MDLHLKPLIAAGFLSRDGDTYRLVPDQPVTAALEQLLRTLGASIASSG